MVQSFVVYRDTDAHIEKIKRNSFVFDKILVNWHGFRAFGFLCHLEPLSVFGWLEEWWFIFKNYRCRGRGRTVSIPINTSWNGCNVTFDLVYVNYELRNIYVGLSMIKTLSWPVFCTFIKTHTRIHTRIYTHAHAHTHRKSNKISSCGRVCDCPYVNLEQLILFVL